ncbi:FKBP-type peptidyl-prolyl cis-trans isomerase [Leucothrix pacifica]|uniref:Peptidyl-prolyl cis-trans isomerase n=1 Tax=Leucothrix pacifica TaxID=1247513 RepID=A0A317CDU8_9GAMM|nr:FKBP-type peptidyl-prolyl cis-trans isomerase [Leucothrix pacifica]PWQ96557.1 peptidylprolyl isomerase [Leucothrix pacifica]
MNYKNILTITAIASTTLILAACGSNNSSSESASVAPKAMTSIAGFQKIDTRVGQGPMAQAGQTVSVHYTGWLYDNNAADKRGTKFDSSVDRGQPFEFPLGAGRVIKGWDNGVAGMQVGGKRTLIIPSDMGYGTRGAGSKIPPNATLLFDVELLGIN